MMAAKKRLKYERKKVILYTSQRIPRSGPKTYSALAISSSMSNIQLKSTSVEPLELVVELSMTSCSSGCYYGLWS